MNVDVLAIGAHPDDVELGVGGLLAKLAQDGYTTAILDLTRGEMGSRGTVETRASEAAEAARILGVAHRENAGLPDGGLANTPAQRKTVAQWIRRFRPTVLLFHMTPDRHPDHAEAHALCRDANFDAGLHKLDLDEAPHRAAHRYAYHPYHEPPFPPSFVVDISAVFEAKEGAIAAYGSQFHNPGFEGPPTEVASADFRERITLRARYWGDRAGFRYGEPLYCLDVPGLPGLPPLLQPCASAPR